MHTKPAAASIALHTKIRWTTEAASGSGSSVFIRLPSAALAGLGAVTRPRKAGKFSVAG